MFSISRDEYIFSINLAQPSSCLLSFKEKIYCSCHGKKKCAHRRGTGQCDCKAAGEKCGDDCSCDEQICKNRVSV